MEEGRIGEIVIRVFDKAKERCVSIAKSALSNEIANEITEKFRYINYRTLERAYDRYVNKKDKDGPPNAESVDLFCKYLDYTDYKDFVEKNPLAIKISTIDNITNKKNKEIVKGGESGDINVNEESNKDWKIVLKVGLGLAAILLVIFIVKNLKNPRTETIAENRCMTWALNHYEEISCAIKPYSEYGTEVESYEEVKIKNFKKIKVTMATDFFAPITNKPLVWYAKNKNGEIEYFTSPGLHPITGKTLDEITPYIIQKYVPLHSNKVDSFVN